MNSILAFILVYFNIVEVVNSGTAADCPAGWRYLNVCLAGQCPTRQQAGFDYYCFRAGDVCCGPPIQQQNPNQNQNQGNGCVDGASNCALFIGSCNTPAYYQCMAQHCRRTCGFCNG